MRFADVFPGTTVAVVLVAMLSMPLGQQASAEPILLAQAETTGSVRFEPESSVPSEDRERFEQGFAWGESAPEESNDDSEQQAAERAQLEAELEQARQEAERAKAEAARQEAAAKAEAEAAAKARAEAEAAMKRAEEESRKRAAAEEARKAAEAKAQADADAAIKRAEEESRKRAEAEQARREAETEAAQKRAEQESARQKAEAERKAAETQRAKDAREKAQAEQARTTKPAQPSGDPDGTIIAMDIDSAAEQQGVSGVLVTVSAEALNLAGVNLETAVYFYDDAGDRLMDRDREFRSSSGQVYVGRYREAASNPFGWKEELFIPHAQLDIPAGGEHAIQAKVILWQYGSGKGRAFAQSGLAPLTFTQGPTAHDRRMNIAGAWSDGVSIALGENGYTVDGLDMPGKIEDQRWVYSDGVLNGVVNLRRRLGVRRIATYELTISRDGNTLSGTSRLTDRNGEAVRETETVTITR